MGKTKQRNKFTRKAKQIKMAKELDDLFFNSENYNWGD